MSSKNEPESNTPTHTGLEYLENDAFDQFMVKMVNGIAPIELERQTLEYDVGDQIAERFELIERLGEGGMGVVFRARDLKLGRYVAVKLLTLESQNAMNIFRREATSMARLAHSNIVTLYDSGISEKYPYLILEYLQGKTLSKALRLAPGRRFVLSDAVAVGLDVAQALQYAHKQGVVHRDLKPANIFLPFEGPKAKLLDFGLADLDLERQSLIKAFQHGHDTLKRLLGTLPRGGTPDYMAPEQWSQDLSGLVDVRVDIWALGVVMFEMLVGYRPKSSWSDERDDSNLSDALHFIPDLPDTLKALIVQALMKDPNERPENLNTFIQILQQTADSVKPQHTAQKTNTLLLASVDDESSNGALDQGDHTTIEEKHSAPLVEHAFQIGTIIADCYVLVGHLGEGGSGEVWEVEHRQTGTRLALKIVRSDQTKDEVHERFEREIMALARFEHLNITQLVDEGYEEQLQCRFFVMELVQGQPFSSSGLAIGEVLEYFAQVLAALSHAHAKGFIHRDLKPENALLQSEPSLCAKVMDFGIVGCRTWDGPSLTMDSNNAIVGTLPYMSPEQANGQLEATGVASDLYTVGVMLYEALSGEPPFNGPALVTFLFQHIFADPPPLVLLPHLAAGISEGVFQELKILVKDLLRKKYNERPESAADVRNRLVRILRRIRSTLDTKKAQRTSASEPPQSRITLLEHKQALEHAFKPGTEQPRSVSWRLPFLRDLPPQGRETEQRALQHFAADVAQSGQARVFELIGAVGIGKRRLGRWLVEQVLEQGTMRVFEIPRAQRSNLESAVHLALYRLLRLPQLEANPLQERIQDTFGFAAEDQQIERLVKFMLRQSSPALSDEGSWQAALNPHCLAQMVARPRPLLLWMNGGDAEEISRIETWLSELLTDATLSALPVAVLWSHDAAAPSQKLAAHLGHAATSLHLGPLDAQHAQHMATQLVPGLSKESQTDVEDWCKGNPLFIRELLTHLRQSDAFTVNAEGFLKFDQKLLLHGEFSGKLEKMMSRQLEVYLGSTPHPGRLKRVLMLLALLGPSLTHNLVHEVLKFNDLERDLRAETLVRQGWLSRGAYTREAQYTISSVTLRSVLLHHAQTSTQYEGLILDAIQWHLRSAMRTMLHSDWEAAIEHTQSAYTLADQHRDIDRTSPLLVNALVNLARIHYRQRDAQGVTLATIALQTEAQQNLQGNLKERANVQVTLWTGMAGWLGRDKEHSSRLLHNAIAHAERIGDSALDLQGQALLYLSQIVLAQDHTKAAANILNKASVALTDALAQPSPRSHFERMLLRLTEADAVLNLAEIRARQGKYNTARDLLLHVGNWYKGLGDLQGEAHAFLLLTRSLRQELEEQPHPDPKQLNQLKHYVNALQQRMAPLSDRHGQAWALAEEAYHAMLEENYLLGIDRLGQAAHLLAIIPDPLNEAICINSQGEAYRKAGLFNEAFAHYQTFRQAMVKLKHPLGEGTALNNMGWIAVAQSNHEQAWTCFSQAQDVLGNNTSAQLRATIAIGQAVAATETQPENQVIDRLLLALELTEGQPVHDPDARSALTKLVANTNPQISNAASALLPT